MNSQLPKLGWVAVLDRPAEKLTLLHGDAVEVGPFGLVEGTWDGEYEEFGFHQEEHLFGSGVRVDGDVVHFVPSSAHVDRLLYAEMGAVLVVSNSLVLLLATIGARQVPTHSYCRESHAITRGIGSYCSSIPVAHPSIAQIHQLYHCSLVVGRESTSTIARTNERAFRTFSEYRKALDEAIDEIGRNLSSRHRRHPIGLTATLSSGYDSTAAAALARHAGLCEAVTSRKSNSGLPGWMTHATVDDGTPIGEQLGLRVSALMPPESVGLEEVYFVAAGTWAPELIFHSLFRDVHESGQVRALVSGYYGDLIWGLRTPPPYRDEQMRWNDINGVALSEARLWAGIIQLPVPFLFGRSIASVFQISHSNEMAPWRLGTKYDRPIPRRIVEEAGVDRRAFGQRKKAVVQHYRIPWNSDLRDSFFEFLGRRGVRASTTRTSALIDRVLTSIRPSSDEPMVLLHQWAVDHLVDVYVKEVRALDLWAVESVRAS